MYLGGLISVVDREDPRKHCGEYIHTCLEMHEQALWELDRVGLEKKCLDRYAHPVAL